jgi:heme-degrading monooxygenase HmoA
MIVFRYHYLALALPTVIFVIRVLRAVAQANGILPNPYIQGVDHVRNTALVPNLDGHIDEDKREKIAVLHLGARTNHPYGTLDPNFRQVSGWAEKMYVELYGRNGPRGFLGATSWVNRNERDSVDTMVVSYWRNISDIHDYAHGPLHREAWAWWDRNIKELKAVGIYHEIYEASPQHWESVYINLQPHGLGATAYLRKGGKLETGVVDEKWVRPLVEARRGKLARSSGRLGIAPIKHDADRPAPEEYEL